MFDGIHAQGGIAGYAHPAWAAEYYRRRRPELNNGALAHTSAVCILVDSEGTGNRQELTRLAEKRLKVLEFVEGRLQDTRYTGDYRAGEVQALRSRVEEARSQYRKLSEGQR